MNNRKTITIAWTGASGINYGLKLVEEIVKQDIKVILLISDAAKVVLKAEHDIDIMGDAVELQSKIKQIYPDHWQLIKTYDKKDWFCPAASGSNTSDAMVVCPCSSSTLSSIANGSSNNLIERAADVTIKEKKKLIIVPRETPISVLHLEHMLKLAKLNTTIIPASPAFYHKPNTISDLVDFIVERILDHLDLSKETAKRWGKQ